MLLQSNGSTQQVFKAESVNMNSHTMEIIQNCVSVEEANIMCDVMGEKFDESEFLKLRGMENWEKTLYLYHKSCYERDIEDILS